MVRPPAHESGTAISFQLAFSDSQGQPVVNGTLSGQIHAGPESSLDVDLSLDRTMLRLPGLSATVAGSFSGTVLQDVQEILLDSWTLTFMDPSSPALESGVPLPDLTLTGTATHISSDLRFQAGSIQLRINAETLATGQAGLSPDGRLRGRCTLSVPILFDLFSTLLPGWPLQLDNRQAWGQDDLKLTFSLPSQGVRDGSPVTLELISRKPFQVTDPASGRTFSMPPGELGLEVTASAARPTTMLMKTRFKARERFELGPVRIAPLELSTQLIWDGRQLLAEDTDIRTSQLELKTASRTVRSGPLQISSPGLRLLPGLATEQPLKLAFQELGTLLLELDSDPEKGTLRATCETSQLELTDLLRLTSEATGAPLGSWSTQGSLSCAGSFENRQSSTAIKADCQVNDLALSSPDGSILTDKVAARLRSSLQAIDQTRRLAAELEILTGEALWGTRYADFEAAPLTLGLQGASGNTLWPAELDLQAAWAGMGEMTLEAVLDRTQEGLRARGDTRLESSNLARSLEFAAPGLAMSGKAGLDGRFAATRSGAAISGRFQAEDLSMESAQNSTRIVDASLDLPFHVLLGSADRDQFAPPSWGRIDPGKVSIQGQKVQISPVAVSLRPGRLLTRGALNLAMPGFEGQLRDLAVLRPLSPDFEARASFEVKELDLGTLSSKSFPVQGRIQGKLDPVVLNPERLSIDGTLSGSVFGGATTVSDLLMLRPFDASREYGGSCQVKALHLEDLSSSIGVGRVTGRMDLQVQNLRMAYGQPVEFALRARSVPEQGVKRRISLQAVNSLSIIGTGRGLSGLGIRFYANFFKEFPYQDIGLACVLNNDVFTLSGLIQEGGVEYIVKRPLLGINVINTTPRNRIAFSDMLKRINRIAKQTDAKGHNATGNIAN